MVVTASYLVGFAAVNPEQKSINFHIGVSCFGAFELEQRPYPALADPTAIFPSRIPPPNLQAKPLQPLPP
jgi:hypothetical protein